LSGRSPGSLDFEYLPIRLKRTVVMRFKTYYPNESSGSSLQLREQLRDFQINEVTEFPFKPILEEYKHQNLGNIRECYFYKKTKSL
jgi:hypothetical protein